jgi:hypothetical protein
MIVSLPSSDKTIFISITKNDFIITYLGGDLQKRESVVVAMPMLLTVLHAVDPLSKRLYNYSQASSGKPFFTIKCFHLLNIQIKNETDTKATNYITLTVLFPDTVNYNPKTFRLRP